MINTILCLIVAIVLVFFSVLAAIAAVEILFAGHDPDEKEEYVP